MALALGKTVGELEATMSRREIEVWMAYRAKHGPLSYERMFDRPAALLGMILSRANGGKATMEELMPYGREPKPEPSVQDFLSRLGGAKRGKRKSR